MTREQKLEMIQRSLGIRHKLKVYSSMKAPDTHEELALMLLAQWELEDELRAIEDLIGEWRHENIETKRQAIRGGAIPLKKKMPSALSAATGSKKK
jgi:hypothetical protein